MNIKLKIKHILRTYGYEISRIGNVNLLESMIYKYNHSEFFFIQIGANNGKRFDPIFNIVKTLDLQGLALEPVKEYFDELVINYKNTKVTPINKAIYSENSPVVIHRAISNKNLPEWTKGIASLNPEHFKKSNTHSKNIIQETVNGITFSKLLFDNNIKHVDLLQIDTEGYDKEIIHMIPFDKIKPRLINFEHGLKDNLMSVKDFSKITELLLNNNYKLIMQDYDCLAYL